MDNSLTQNGNPITCSDGREFDYDYENRLTRLTSSAYQTDFAYNGFGDRIKKIHQTFARDTQEEVDSANLPFMMSADKGRNTDVYYNELGDMSESRSVTANEYVYDDLGRQIFWKRTIDGNVTNVYYSYGYGMEARRVNSSMNYLHSDILGSITAITNASGSAMSTYEYDPYGIMLSGNTNVLGNFGFTGQEIDLETGYYHFPARYYEPYWGRFLTPDPWTGMPDDERNLVVQQYSPLSTLTNHTIGISNRGAARISPSRLDPKNLNCYSYVSNNPISYTDPTGHVSFGGTKDKLECVASAVFWAWFTHPQYHGGKASPRFKHCWYSCVIAQECGLPASVIAGLLKEAFDAIPGLPGTFDPGDFADDAAGWNCARQPCETNGATDCGECCEQEVGLHAR